MFITLEEHRQNKLDILGVNKSARKKYLLI